MSLTFTTSSPWYPLGAGDHICTVSVKMWEESPGVRWKLLKWKWSPQQTHVDASLCLLQKIKSWWLWHGPSNPLVLNTTLPSPSSVLPAGANSCCCCTVHQSWLTGGWQTWLGVKAQRLTDRLCNQCFICRLQQPNRVWAVIFYCAVSQKMASCHILTLWITLSAVVHPYHHLLLQGVLLFLSWWYWDW